MTNGGVSLRMGVVMLSVGLLMAGSGCASRQVASTSGDQSTTLKGKGETAGAVENVKQEPFATIDESSGTSAKEPQAGLSAPGSSTLPSSSPAPSGTGLAPGEPRMAAASDMTSIGDVYFDFDQYNIRRDAEPVLERNAQWLRAEAGKSFVIEGHCDERGTLAYNLVLGEKRAKSVKRYLEDLGIPGSRIQTTSYGEVRPFCKDHNEGCWSQNRRAHFVVH